MIRHLALGDNRYQRSKRLYLLIGSQQVVLAGNVKLKIYGTLSCASGKRINLQNRVFFASEQEALQLGFRPCGHCLKQAYQNWKMAGRRQ